MPLLATAGGLLPHPFTPHLPAQDLRTAAALLSVAVVVTPPIVVVRPHLLFHGAIVSAVPKRSREVPLLTADQQRRRNLFWVQLLSCRSRCLSGPLPPDFSYYFVLCPAGCQVVTAQGVRFKVLQQVKQLLMYRTPVSSPKALDQSTAGTAARWATRSAKLGGSSRLRTRRRSASSMGSGAKLIRPDGVCERKPAVDRRIGGDAGVAASGEPLRAPTVREGLSLSCISPPSVHLVAARQSGSPHLRSVCWHVAEPSLTVGALSRELSHSAQESFRVSPALAWFV